MKKIMTLVLTLTVIAAVSLAGDKPADQSGAKIQFKDISHEFGDVKKGEKATHAFEFTNVGTEPLTLTGVRPSCGCTAPEWTREPVMPGETGVVKAQFNSANQRVGRFHKSIRVSSNSVDGQVTLFIRGEVVE